MPASLTGKVAIVTGSSRGIGREIAMTLAARGARFAVNYPCESEAAAAATVVATIEADGGSAVAVRADVTKVHEIEALFASTAAAFEGIDIVVSNAGGATTIKPIVEVTEAEYDAATALNAKGNFFVLREAARTVRDNGRIIVIGSSATAKPYAGSSIYAGAKGAAELHARVLAREIGSRGITVNAVSPGLIDTDGARDASQAEERFAMAIRMTPLGRIGRPDDIADVVAFVASEDARWITGQNLRVGGGII